MIAIRLASFTARIRYATYQLMRNCSPVAECPRDLFSGPLPLSDGLCDHIGTAFSDVEFLLAEVLLHVVCDIDLFFYRWQLLESPFRGYGSQDSFALLTSGIFP